MQYELEIINKFTNKTLLIRYFKDKNDAIKDFHELVNTYHNKKGRYLITLFDVDKQTNIEEYDTDNQI
ncbi:hypothetical protein [Clostridium sp.]|uniref:hypothetical protein n=1 Tax=Clostridium sp. TaxID=1506 RepID=UPI0025C4E8EE|nr:hypothetical protein [Clostridium sp.]